VAAANAEHARLKERAKEFDSKASKLQRDISAAEGAVEGLVTRQAQLMEDAVVNQVRWQLQGACRRAARRGCCWGGMLGMLPVQGRARLLLRALGGVLHAAATPAASGSGRDGSPRAPHPCPGRPQVTLPTKGSAAAAAAADDGDDGDAMEVDEQAEEEEGGDGEAMDTDGGLHRAAVCALRGQLWGRQAQRLAPQRPLLWLRCGCGCERAACP
jgi:hypothetical protein